MARRSTAPVNKKRTLVAAAKRVVGPKAGKLIPAVTDVQKALWEFYELVPDLKESVWYLGNQIAKAQLFVGVIDPDGVVVPVTDPKSGVEAQLAAAAVEELDRLSLSSGGIPEYLRIANMNWEVAGEYYLVGFAERTVQVRTPEGTTIPQVLPEEWMAVSAQEILKADEKIWLLEDPDLQSGGRREIQVANPEKPETLINPDYLERMYLRHPRARNKCDSLLSALRVDLAWLVALKYQGLAEANSRRNAGIFLIPSELDASIPRAVSADQEHPDDAENDPILMAIDASVTAPLADPSAASTVMPVYLKGAAEYLKEVRHLEFGRTTDASVMELIKALVETIARGANMPVERLMGSMQTTYANGAQIDVDELEDFHRPRLEQHVDALTSGFLRPRLEAKGLDPLAVGALLVWYDPSGLMRDPDPAESADYGFENMLISAEAWRRVKGWTKDDQMMPEEMLMWAALKATMPGTVILELLKALAPKILGDVALPAPPPQGALPAAPTEDEEAVEKAEAQAAIRAEVDVAVRRALAAAALDPRVPRSILAGRSGLN